MSVYTDIVKKVTQRVGESPKIKIDANASQISHILAETWLELLNYSHSDVAKFISTGLKNAEKKPSSRRNIKPKKKK